MEQKKEFRFTDLLALNEAIIANDRPYWLWLTPEAYEAGKKKAGKKRLIGKQITGQIKTNVGGK